MLKQFPVGLNENQKKWLDKESDKTGFKMAHIIRELINKEMREGIS